jgi:hypothetical protein
MQSVAETLQALADAGHSRTSAHKAMGISWHMFRSIEGDYPMVKFKSRAPKFDDETLATAMEWRSEGIEWKYIAIGLGVNHESLRHAVDYRCR